jgi:hypothetical protein
VREEIVKAAKISENGTTMEALCKVRRNSHVELAPSFSRFLLPYRERIVKVSTQ